MTITQEIKRRRRIALIPKIIIGLLIAGYIVWSIIYLPYMLLVPIFTILALAAFVGIIMLVNYFIDNSKKLRALEREENRRQLAERLREEQESSLQ